MATLISYEEQQSIKPISENNAHRFGQIMFETEVKDIQPLLGVDLYQAMIQDREKEAAEREERFSDLIGGKIWETGGKVYNMRGLKYVLAYMFYANYMEQSSVADTFSGFVQHNFTESSQIDPIEKKRIVSMNREIAARYWDECKKYITANANIFPEFGNTERVFSPKIFRLDLL